MKKIVTLLLFLPLSTLAQKNLYGTLTLTDFNYAHDAPAIGGSFSFGWHGKVLGLGGGIGLVSLPGTTTNSSAYIPVFGEVSLFSNRRRVRPTFNLQAGYGIYQNNVEGGAVNETGGFYYRTNLGLLLPVARHSDILLSVGYVNSTFNVSGPLRRKNFHVCRWLDPELWIQILNSLIMNNIDSGELFAAAAAALFFNAFLLYLIIGWATKASQRARYEGATLEILGRIAKQLGVPQEDIKKTFDKFK